jgi:hypothetical protein
MNIPRALDLECFILVKIFKIAIELFIILATHFRGYAGHVFGTANRIMRIRHTAWNAVVPAALPLGQGVNQLEAAGALVQHCLNHVLVLLAVD